MEIDKQIFRIGNELAETLVQRLSGLQLSGKVRYRRAMLFFFCRAWKAYRATVVLWREGFTEDVHSTASTVCEAPSVDLSEPTPGAAIEYVHGSLV
jgi:hypothetical protein